MKKQLIPVSLLVMILALLTGCFGLSLGGGSTTRTEAPTLGQELVDLQRAREAGALTEVEFDSEKAKLLRRR
jgi:hypothetical protein